MAFIAIAAGVVTAGGMAYSAYNKNQSQQAAIKAERDALSNLQDYNIPQLESLASTQDLAKYKQQFEAQAQVDPAFAQLRNSGAAGLNAVVASDASGKSVSDNALAGLSENTAKNTSQNQPLIDSLISQAKNELASGATLPPEFQAELVRSGLQSAGAGGMSIDGTGAGGTGIRTLVGSAGLSLQAQRQAQAEGLASSAEGLQSQGQSALFNLATLGNNLTQSKFGRAGAAAAAGNANVPNIGLTGSNAVSLSMANTQAKNAALTQAGNLSANSALSTGNMWNGIAGAGTSLATSALGPGGWLSGLMTPTTTVTPGVNSTNTASNGSGAGIIGSNAWGNG